MLKNNITKTSINVLDIEISDHDKDTFAVFGDDKTLYLRNTSEENITLLAHLPDITIIKEIDRTGLPENAVISATKAMPVKLYYHHPYVCVTERFGTQAVVVDVRNGSIQSFSREDYHADVSSYSIGFLERNGKTLLLHQTEWNRIDITDLESGNMLTGREVFRKLVAEGHQNENGVWVDPKYEDKNYKDYFHSLLHVSPNYQSFLSNGWIWSPVDNICYYQVEKFLTTYEPGGTEIAYGGGYNWDRPCTFIDNDIFVISVDNDGQEEEYHQLWYYRISDIGKETHWKNFKKAKCDVFGTNEYGEVAGDLYFDQEKNVLVAISDKGGSVLNADGVILKTYPEMARQSRNTHTDFGSAYAKGHEWKYSKEHHLFYHFSQESRCIETKPL